MLHSAINFLELQRIHIHVFIHYIVEQVLSIVRVLSCLDDKDCVSQREGIKPYLSVDETRGLIRASMSYHTLSTPRCNCIQYRPASKKLQFIRT